MIAVIDYGMGNLRSVAKALSAVGGTPLITSRPQDVSEAERIVLPGVGAFGAAVDNLRARDLFGPIQDAARSAKPFLGICLGLQLLFESSSEAPGIEGLGVLPGAVVRFERSAAGDVKVPHMGWNALEVNRRTRLLAGVCTGDRAYFVHSYYPVPLDGTMVTATTDHGSRFCCAVEVGSIAGVQFHPEKSGSVGLEILRNFVRWNRVENQDGHISRD